MDANWRNTLLVCRTVGGDQVVPEVTVTPEQQTPMRVDLLGCFELSELEKYYTEAELADHPERSS
jgi:succinate dehydrogenase / fumarate reductase flavoprotein subunit